MQLETLFSRQLLHLFSYMKANTNTPEHRNSILIITHKVVNLRHPTHKTQFLATWWISSPMCLYSGCMGLMGEPFFLNNLSLNHSQMVLSALRSIILKSKWWKAIYDVFLDLVSVKLSHWAEGCLLQEISEWCQSVPALLFLFPFTIFLSDKYHCGEVCEETVCRIFEWGAIKAFRDNS